MTEEEAVRLADPIAGAIRTEQIEAIGRANAALADAYRAPREMSVGHATHLLAVEHLGIAHAQHIVFGDDPVPVLHMLDADAQCVEGLQRRLKRIRDRARLVLAVKAAEVVHETADRIAVDLARAKDDPSDPEYTAADQAEEDAFKDVETARAALAAFDASAVPA